MNKSINLTAESKTHALLARQNKVLLPVMSQMLLHGDDPIAFSHGKDQWLFDVEGNQYLDFFGGILTVSVGHANEEITNATIQQLKILQHTSALYINENTIRLAEKLADITPGNLQQSFFTNSGTEANETAIMAARNYTGNTDIIALRHAYSGRSSTAMSMTAHSHWRQGGVYDGTIKHVKNPYRYRFPLDVSDEQFMDYLVDDLKEMIRTCTTGKIAAFMAEPIQGVGGFIVAPKDYFKRILPIVKEAGGVLIIDEVQTGWGRTGKHLCAIEHWGVEPDIMVFAKGIANGAPMGATIMTSEIAKNITTTLSTYGGNPVTTATALATIKFIEENNLVDNAEQQGNTLGDAMRAMKKNHDFIGDVRGMGLMQAFEIVNPDGSKTPDAEKASQIVDAARKRGLLIGKGGLYGNTLRIAPHLNVSTADMANGLEIIEASLRDIA